MPEENINVTIALLKQDVTYIKQAVGEIKKGMEETRGEFVLKADFDPVKNLVYGLVAIILVGVVGAIVSLVLKQ